MQLSAIQPVRTDLPQMLRDLKDLDGERVTGTPGYARAVETLQTKLAAIPGWQVHVEKTTSGGRTLINLVADHAGTAPAAGRKLVVAGAHLDTVRTSPGANDDATGSVALLGLARALGSTETAQDIRLVWFDAEEEGLRGSQKYVAKHADETERMSVMIEAEMLASPKGAPVLLFGGDTDARAGASLIASAKALGVPLVVEKERPYGSDHNSFADAGVPAMVLTTTAPIGPNPLGRIKHDDPGYHSAGDTIAHLKTEDLGRLTDVLATAVLAYAGA